MASSRKQLVRKLAEQRAVTADYPGQRAVNDPIVDAVMRQVDRFWTQRNVQSPGLTRVEVADSLADADGLEALGRGDAGSTEILLNARSVGGWLAGAREGATRRQQRRNVRRLYAALAHEEGHVRGLGHTSSGIMSQGTTFRSAPGDWRGLMAELRASDLIPNPPPLPASSPRRHRRKRPPGRRGSG